MYYISYSPKSKRWVHIFEKKERHIYIFFTEGSIVDSWRRVFVPSESLVQIESRHLIIVRDDYNLEIISKDLNPKEYQKLKELWESQEKINE
ncbi:hypothetical protein COU57_03585 [Candidatus Pacearchaeota archaeon CG10_big_fil_rev_8_21_14_0_10_32_14]|nr:MAG: hypothetical protein COU57_03585 [Candidatus Pacearchaeota archaeon CG10_big_fil_rev_8_21_14_0_10_32_14]